MRAFWSSCLAHPALVGGALLFSVVALIGSVLLVPRYLAHLPEDYLTSAHHHHRRLDHSLALRVGRNLLGALLVAVGAAMLVLPGQGLITLLVGLMLLDFPGKHRLLQKVLGQPKVLRAVNALRRRAGRGPLTPPF